MIGKVYIHEVSNELFNQIESHFSTSTKKVQYEAILDYMDQNDLLNYITKLNSKNNKEMKKLIALLSKAIKNKIHFVHIHTEPKD